LKCNKWPKKKIQPRIGDWHGESGSETLLNIRKRQKICHKMFGVPVTQQNGVRAGLVIKTRPTAINRQDPQPAKNPISLLSQLDCQTC
jgi:hypothetical protein